MSTHVAVAGEDKEYISNFRPETTSKIYTPWRPGKCVCVCVFCGDVRCVEVLLLLLLQGGIAQGVPSTVTITDILCIPIGVLVIPNSFTRAV
jgi:hypothetical protein